MARARSTASEFSSSRIFGWATGRLHRNRASRSMSPDSSRVSQTVATWLAEKFSVGNAKSGLGARIGCDGCVPRWGLVPPVGPTAIEGRTTARLKIFGAILSFVPRHIRSRTQHRKLFSQRSNNTFSMWPLAYRPILTILSTLNRIL